MVLSRRTKSAAVVLLTALVLGACSSGSSAKKSDKAQAEPEAGETDGNACELVTRSKVQSALGVTIEGDGDSNQVGPAANCDWKADGQFIRLAVVQANSPVEASQSFDALGGRPGAQPVSDLGERAVFLGTPETMNAQLFILSGNRLVTLSYCCANQEQLVDAGRKAIGRLE